MSRDSDQKAPEFVQISLLPTCSGALVAALVLLLAGFGAAGRCSRPPGYWSGALVASLMLLVAALVL